MIRNNILIIDTSSIMNSVKYSGRTIKTRSKLSYKEKPTFIVYGFLLSLMFYQKKVDPDMTVFCMDTKRKHSKRKKIFPEYKAGRDKKEKEQTEEAKELDKLAYIQFDAITEQVIPSMGYRNILKKKGFEADDFIAQVCKQFSEHNIVIVTSDEDMYQCLNENVVIISPQTKKIMTHRTFKKKYGIPPTKWSMVKAIGGCTSDEVPGIEGVKETRAIQYLLGTLPEHYKAYKEIVNGKNIIKRNKKLVTLPFKGTPKVKIQPDRLTKKPFFKLCKQYGFKSILNSKELWKNTFHLR